MMHYKNDDTGNEMSTLMARTRQMIHRNEKHNIMPAYEIEIILNRLNGKDKFQSSSSRATQPESKVNFIGAPTL